MNIKENIGKITWSVLDKVLFVIFGLVMLIQIKHLTPIEFGLFSLIWNLNNWLLGISDSFALQGLVQFGANYENRSRVNFIATTLNLLLLLFFPLILFFISILFKSYLSPEFYTTFYYIPIFTITAIPRTIVLKILTREFRYKEIFWTNFIYFGSMSFLTLYYILSFSILKFENMLNIFVIGGALSSIFSIIVAKKSLKFDNSRNHKFTFKEYIKFSLPMTLVSLCQSVPRNLDIYFIALTMGANSTFMVGLYNSAKTLYRVIEEINSAAYSLMYPVAVKYVNLKDYASIRKIYIKAVSNLLLTYIFIIGLSYLGLIDLVIELILPEKYQMSIGIFKVMILAALPLPFVLLLVLSTAENNTKRVLNYVTISAILSIIAFLIAGYSNNIYMMPLGILVYNISLGVLSFNYFKKNIGFPIRDVGLAIRDIKNFIVKR